LWAALEEGFLVCIAVRDVLLRDHKVDADYPQLRKSTEKRTHRG
jgi:hypothetical protein